MQSVIVAIDGACRGNGKPDCLSTGSAVFMFDNTFKIFTASDQQSSNQRGEMIGLLKALDAMTWLPNRGVTEVVMVMDSEFLFNALTKDWIGNWERKGWVTAEGNPVKSQDLWKQISEILAELDKLGIEIIPYHIKGHLVSLGKVTAAKMLEAHPDGEVLHGALWNKYDQDMIKNQDKWDAALQLFQRNHGFLPPDDIFKKFVVLNTLADYAAGTHADNLIR